MDILKTKDKNFYEKITYTALQSGSRETVEAILTLNKNILSAAKITADLLDLVLVKDGNCINIPAVKDEVAKIFLESIENGNIEKVKKILLHYPDWLDSPLQHDDAENYPVALAAQLDKEELVEFLLQQGAKFSPARKNKLGTDEITILKAKKIDVQRKFLLTALNSNNLETIQTILMANPDLVFSYFDGDSLLSKIGKCSQDIEKACLRMPCLKGKMSKLFYTAIRTGDLESVKKIFQYHPELGDAEIKSDIGNTDFPIVFAARYRRQDIIEYFMERGIKFSPSRKNKLGISDVVVLKQLDRQSQKSILALALKVRDVDTSRAVLAANPTLGFSYSDFMTKDILFTKNFGKFITETNSVSFPSEMVK